MLKSKKAPGLAKGRKFKKNSDFWMYEKKIRFWIRKTIKKQWFYWFVILLVFFNTCSVAVEHYDQPKWLSEFLGKLLMYNKYQTSYDVYEIIESTINRLKNSLRQNNIMILIFLSQIGQSTCFLVCSSLKCFCECGPWDQMYIFRPRSIALTAL